MKEDRGRILAMLASGKISVDQADRLLSAIVPAKPKDAEQHAPKFLRLLLEPKADARRQRKVDIRMPLGIIRSGVQIARSLPIEKQGPMTIALGTHTLAVDLSGVDPQNVDQFMALFKDLTTDIDKKDETLRLFCE
jgi:hypothetical protein